MDRDINASKNILYLLTLQKTGKKRPECFLPSPEKEEPKIIITHDTLLGDKCSKAWNSQLPF